MKNFKLTYIRFSETSILVQWTQHIAPEILEDVLIFKAYLESLKSQSIFQVTHSYNSILISYDFYIDDFETQVDLLKSQYSSRLDLEEQKRKLWNIPVCYDASFGLDLEEISKEKNSNISDIIQQHSEAIYKVYFIGFLPGFLYLGGLDERLFMSRKKSPRQHIKKGAVAIGEEQTGVYPNVSPGGWNIIGNSPIDFFDPKLETPCFANAGDSIRFVSVDFKTHQEILKAVQNGTYNIENEVRDD